MSAVAEQIARHALELQGTPFRHQGRNPAVGLDCVGLVYVAAKRSGLIVDNFTGYPPCPSPMVVMRELRKRFDLIPEPAVGDVVLLKDTRTGAARHVGVVCGPDRMVVCDEERGVRQRRFCSKMMRAAFRVKGRRL